MKLDKTSWYCRKPAFRDDVNAATACKFINLVCRAEKGSSTIIPVICIRCHSHISLTQQSDLLPALGDALVAEESAIIILLLSAIV